MRWMQADLYLKNAIVVTEAGTFRGGVVVADGTVVQVVAGCPDLMAATCLDLHGRWLLPGLVAGHVHFNEPGRTDWEGFGTYIPDYAVGISGSRITGVPDGIAPPRAAAPVPRAGTGTDGSPARTKMLIAAL